MSEEQKQEAEMLPFAAWVELSARLNGLDGDARFDALEAADVELAVFDRSERHWQATLFSEARAGDKTRMRAYGARCAAVMQERRAATANAPERRPEAARRPDAAASAAPPPQVQLASFMKEQPQVQVLEPPPGADISLDSTGEIQLRPGPVLPFSPGAAAQAPLPKPSPEPPAPRRSSGDPLERTAETRVEGGAVAVLPFHHDEKERR